MWQSDYKSIEKEITQKDVSFMLGLGRKEKSDKEVVHTLFDKVKDILSATDLSALTHVKSSKRDAVYSSQLGLMFVIDNRIIEVRKEAINSEDR